MQGYNKIRLNHQLVLDLTMEEVSGAAGDYIHDRARPHHDALLHGATIGWTQLLSGLYVMDFTAGSPDWLDIGAAASADLDFTTEDFSVGEWVNLDSLAANRSIMCRGLLDTDGWHCQVLMDGSIIFFTNQLGADQYSQSSAGLITVGYSYLVGFSRREGSVRCYINGVDVTETAGTHIDPATANRELHIGIYDNETGSPWEGQKWRPRIWGSRVIEDWEWLELFNMERHWFGA
jgi:hypothetical protein